MDSDVRNVELEITDEEEGSSLTKKPNLPLSKNSELNNGPSEVKVIESDHLKQKPNKHSTQTQDSPPRPQFTIGAYDVMVPNQKVPLLGVMASALILLIAIFLKGVLDDNRSYGEYGLIVAFVTLVVSFVSLFMPTGCTWAILLMNSFLFVWTFVGACFLTFESGPFTYTGNGYFAAWGCAIFSGCALGFRENYLDLGKNYEHFSVPLFKVMCTSHSSFTEKGAASLVVLVMLVFEIKDDPDTYMVEIIYAMIVACITICIIAFLTIKSMRTSRGSKCEAQILIILALLWVACAAVVSFSGPFTETGNGYFGAWIAAVLSVKGASTAWRHRQSD